MVIDLLRAGDWPAVRAIYQAGIANGDATFPTAAPGWPTWDGIFPENRASVRLHQGCGFRVVRVRERLGQLHGRWRDVLLLERRSPAIG